MKISAEVMNRDPLRRRGLPLDMVRFTLLLALVVACGDDDSTLDPDVGVDAAFDTATVDTAPAACTWEGTAVPIDDPPLHTPRWAFEPWISKDISDRADTEQFVMGFIDRDIPVGALVIDSPWETHYNTLIPNEDRYGNFQELVDWVHARDIKIVLWTTQMINSLSFDAETGGDSYRGPSPNLAEARACEFFVNGGQTYGWWKGRGAAIDFFNPRAVAWWRDQQDTVLDMGIDGWKLDFGESYIRDAPDSYAEVDAMDGAHTLQEYSEAYYADFLRYGVDQRGSEFVTMVRGYDVSYDVPARFYARPEHAPVVWMGDNERDWAGLVDALDHAFRSVVAGYVMVGWDIGGYLDVSQDDLLRAIPFDREVFARWTAVSAFMPFFQLHGRANLEPWNIEPAAETVALYRYWATLHSDMVPFWYSLAEDAYAGGDNIIRPIGDEASWADDWRFMVGDALLVAPTLSAGGVRDVELPAGTWYDWWDAAAAPIAGGVTLAAYAGATPLDRVPVFIREGALIPMEVRNDFTGLGLGIGVPMTVLAWPSAVESRFALHDEDGATTTITAQASTLRFSRTTTPVLARIYTELDVGTVDVRGAAATEHADRVTFDAASDGYWIDGPYVWVKIAASDTETVIELLEAL